MYNAGITSTSADSIRRNNEMLAQMVMGMFAKPTGSGSGSGDAPAGTWTGFDGSMHAPGDFGGAEDFGNPNAALWKPLGGFKAQVPAPKQGSY